MFENYCPTFKINDISVDTRYFINISKHIVLKKYVNHTTIYLRIININN